MIPPTKLQNTGVYISLLGNTMSTAGCAESTQWAHLDVQSLRFLIGSPLVTQWDPNLPVVRIRRFHCRGMGSIPGQGTIPMPGGVAKIQKKKKKKKGGGSVFLWDSKIFGNRVKSFTERSSWSCGFKNDQHIVNYRSCLWRG